MQHALPFLIESTHLADLQTPPRRGERHILLGGKALSYTLRRSTRRSIGISVDDKGLHAAAPRWVNIEEVETFIREKQRWILRHLAEANRRTRPAFVWQHGAQLPYLGRDIEIALTENDAIVLHGDRLEVGLGENCSAAALRETVIAWLKLQSLDCFGKKISLLAPQLRVAIPRFGLSQARTQWGSCARKADGSARILLNWKLMHYEAHLIDYVVTHELAHLRHMNHSAAFWRTVARIYPDYEAARLELRQRAHWAPDL